MVLIQYDYSISKKFNEFMKLIILHKYFFFGYYDNSFSQVLGRVSDPDILVESGSVFLHKKSEK